MHKNCQIKLKLMINFSKHLPNIHNSKTTKIYYFDYISLKFNFVPQDIQFVYILQFMNYYSSHSGSYFLSIIDYYKIIIIAFALLLFTILVYLLGTRRNKILVEQYMKLIAPTLTKNFPKFENKIIQQSANVLKVYAEGRKSCIFVILGFAMIPRQQMLSFLFNGIIFRKKDELIIEMPINSNNPPLFACAILRKSYLKYITKKKYPDLKNYCKQQQSQLPSNLLVISENKQLLHLVLNQKTIQVWTQSSHILKIFYMSDSSKLSKYGFCLRLVIELKPKGLDSIPQLLEMVVQMADKLSNIKMSQNNKNHIKKKREQVSI